MDLIQEEHGQKNNPRNLTTALVYDRKLDRALRSSFAHSYNKRRETGRQRGLDRHLEEMMKDCDILVDETHWPQILLRLLGGHRFGFDITKESERASIRSTVIQNVVSLQLKVILENARHPAVTAARAHAHLMEEYTKPHALITTLIILADKLAALNCSCAQTEWTFRKEPSPQHLRRVIQKRQFETPDNELFLFIGYSTMFIRIGSATYHAPKDVLLLFHNKICDLISILLLVQMQCQTIYHRDSAAQVTTILVHMCNLIIRHKTKGFLIMKALEALVVGETLINADGWTNRTFLRALDIDLMESTSFDYMTSDIRLELMQASIPFRHELACLSKMLGHPYVDMEGGAVELNRKTTESYLVNMTKVLETTCYIKQDFISNYLLRHKEWPPVAFDDTLPMDHPLRIAQEKNQDPSADKFKKMNVAMHISDFHAVTLLKCLQFDRHENILPMLKDKTITVLRRPVVQHYIDQIEGAPPISWKDTRLLLSYLLKSSMDQDHSQYLDDYEASYDLSDLLDYLVIRIVPKEKELKVLFRGFGCKTYEDRARSQIQEDNVMRFLDKYNHSQAMTLSELDLAKRLSALRNLESAYPGHQVLYIVLDASSWNNRFRAETVAPVLQATMDSVYGTKIFSKTHLAYQLSLVYVPDSEGTYWWNGQSGGIEGLNQDSWVHIYIGQVRSAMTRVPYRYHILCKGDDLRLAVLVPDHELKMRSINDVRRDIVSELSAQLFEQGHKIKLEESYASASYFAFSKSASIDKAELPQTFRKIQKVYGASNAFAPSLDEYIGATFSNAHSAAKVSATVIPCYLVALHWSVIYLQHHSQYKTCTADELAALMLIPSLAGGFPIIYLHNFHVRAESDLLAPFLQIYQTASRSFPDIATYMERFMTYPHMQKEDKKLLLIDPYGLPQSRPQTATAFLRSLVGDAIKKLTQREEIRELIDASESHLSEAVVDALLSCEPCSVKVLSAIYAATPEGLFRTLLRKFESARSVHELIIISLGGWRKADRVMSQAVKKDVTLNAWRLDKMHGYSADDAYIYLAKRKTCPAEWAQTIRNHAWRCTVEGITMPPMQHLIYMKADQSVDDPEWDGNNHFVTVFDYPTSPVSYGHGRMDEAFRTGDRRPFLGHSTKSGALEPEVQVDFKDAIIGTMTKMLDALSWVTRPGILPDGTRGSGNVHEIIRVILTMYTDTPMDNLTPFRAQHRGSGTVQHHVRAPSFKHAIMPNMLPNPLTRYLGESDSHRTMTDRNRHVRLNFLHVYCYANWCMWLTTELGIRHKIEDEVSWVVTTRCKYCNEEIEDQPMVADIKRLPPKLPPLKATKLGDVASTVLSNSVKEYYASNVNPSVAAVDVDLDTAESAVLNALAVQLQQGKEMLMDRHGAPHAKREGKDVLSNLQTGGHGRAVGDSELKRLKPSKIVDVLFEMTIMETDKWITPGDEKVLEHALNMRHENEMTWLPIIERLCKLQRADTILLEVQSRTGLEMPVNHRNAVVVARYVAIAARVLATHFRHHGPITLVTCYTPESQATMILSKIYTHFMLRLRHEVMKKHHWYVGSFGNYYDEINISGMMLMVAMEKLMENHESLIDLLGENPTPPSVDLSDFLILDPELIVEHIREYQESKRMPKILTRLRFWVIQSFRPDFDKFFAELLILSDNALTDALAAGASLIEEFSVDVKVVLCTLATCVSKVRTDGQVVGRAFGKTTELDTTMVEGMKVSMNTVSREVAASRGSSSLRVFSQNPPVLLTPSPDSIQLRHDESTDQPSISLVRSYRLTGSSTGSETHLLYLLHRVGMPYPRPWPIQACCLADGGGGFTSVILKVYANSHVWYHTYFAPSDREVPYPALVMDLCTASERSRVHCSHLSQGYYSLEHPGLYMAIEADRQAAPFDLITCDVELSCRDYPQNTERPMVTAILDFMRKNLTGNGVAFLKTRTLWTDDLAYAMSCAQMMFARVEICSPPMVRVDRHVYIIVSKPRSQPQRFDTTKATTWAVAAANKIGKKAESVEKMMYKYPVVEHRPLMDLHGIDVIHRTHYFGLRCRAAHILFLFGLRSCETVGKPLHTICAISFDGSSMAWTQNWISLINGLCSLDFVLRGLKDRAGDLLKKEKSLYDTTLSHMVIEFDNAAMTAGFVYTFEEFMMSFRERGNQATWSPASIRSRFLTYIATLPTECRMGPSGNERLAKIYKYENVASSAAVDWIRGCENAIMVASTAILEREKMKSARQNAAELKK